MDFIVFPLIAIITVILIISLVYIISINRNKEKMALIEKGFNPSDYMKDQFVFNTLKFGIASMGMGLGFLLALLMDEFVFPQFDNPAIYPACIFLMLGISLILYHAFLKARENK